MVGCEVLLYSVGACEPPEWRAPRWIHIADEGNTGSRDDHYSIVLQALTSGQVSDDGI